MTLDLRTYIAFPTLVVFAWITSAIPAQAGSEIPAGVEDAVRLELEAAQAALADDAASYGKLGELYAAYALWDGAAECLRQAVELGGDGTWSHLLGWVEEKRGNLEESAASYERALRFLPSSAALWARLGDVRFEAGEDAAARAAYDQALALGGGVPSSAVAHFGLGRLALREGAADDAARQFLTALRLQPRATQIHAPLAQAYRRLGKREGAAAHASRIGPGRIQLDDPRIDDLANAARGGALHKRRGDQAVRAGRYTEAAAAYRDALEADPESYYYRRALALTLVRLGDESAAEAELERALDLARKLPAAQAASEAVDTLYNLAGIALAREDLEAAAERYRGVLGRDPGHADAALYLGDVLRRGGDLDAALGALGQAAELAPERAVVQVLRGRILLDLGRHEAARSALERALKLEPGNARAWELLARASVVEE